MRWRIGRTAYSSKTMKRFWQSGAPPGRRNKAAGCASRSTSAQRNDPDAHRWLDRILYRIEDGWHVWDTASQPDPNAIEAATWIRDRGPQGGWVREMLVASIQRGAWTFAPHGRRVRVTACPGAADELKPEDAVRLADEPLVILVENRDSDGAFVKRVVTEIDKSLHSLWRRLGDPVRFDSLGGAGTNAGRGRASDERKAVPAAVWSPSSIATGRVQTIQTALRFGRCVVNARR